MIIKQERQLSQTDTHIQAGSVDFELIFWYKKLKCII